MDDIDLNIDNYEYEDILTLFDIDKNLDETAIKKAKRKVLLMHPDKSGLDKKFFLFFSSLFKILHSVYEFKEKTKTNLDEEVEYVVENDGENEEIVTKLKEKYTTNKDFNKWFNKEFEKIKLNNDYEDNGYGDWLKNQEDVEVCSNKNEMNEMIDRRKKNLRSLTKFEDINGFNDSGYNDLANSKPVEYSSGMFCKLQFEDLRKAHEESVVPVTDDDFKHRYNSIEDIKSQRNQQSLNPLSKEEGNKILNNQKSSDNTISASRAFKLATQEREASRGVNNFWSSLKQLK
jgi:hypothetical protein|tara:strand:- start:3617 stop:4483 length:867 start_codon:yes stop_codon:yes gene_type:complete